MEKILLDHGAGGRASQELVAEVFVSRLGHQDSAVLEDAALLEIAGSRLAFSTDSYVVTPIFFPGGDIGRLAVHGTVNDLAMRGARPLYLSAGFILEEGLPATDLVRVVDSMAEAAKEARVSIVAGDTKVVPRGAADRIFINTAGVGLVPPGVDISAARARPGDAVIISGTVGDHGLAVLCQREGLSLETPIRSDTAPLGGLVAAALEASGSAIHVLRDPTRGGVGTTLNEIARSSGVGIVLDEEALPVRGEVRGACDILGLDPLYVANEGKALIIVEAGAAEDVLGAVRGHHYGREAVVIGRVIEDDRHRVVLRTAVGGTRIVDMLTGEQLPRIC